jgi:hypothetical protein
MLGSQDPWVHRYGDLSETEIAAGATKNIEVAVKKQELFDITVAGTLLICSS